jgi:hypothetical protein|tara:strand:- start:1906 stop:2055 length:150 start_codon:yes stop_codon:yes gene_type:complete
MWNWQELLTLRNVVTAKQTSTVGDIADFGSDGFPRLAIVSFTSGMGKFF